MRDLIAKLEKLEGPDKAAARQIQCEIGGWHRITPAQCGRKHGGYIAPQDWIGRHADGEPVLDGLHGTTIWPDVPDVTASLDAAIALVERELPGAYRATTGPRKYLNIPTPVPARFRAEIIGDKCTGVGWHDVEPIALIIALLRAKEARDESN